jgi:hypothetical protein
MFCERALKARLNVAWTDVYRIESRFQRYIWERTVSWGTAPGLPVNAVPLALNTYSDTIKDRLILSFGGSHQAARIRLYYRGGRISLIKRPRNP